MAFRRKDDHRYRASDSDTRLTRFRPKYKTAHDKGSERELPEICRYCVRAHKLFDSETMLCERKGVVSCRYTCRKFVYDPLKHVPFQAPAVFDEDMVMPTLDDLPDDIAADAAQPAQTSDTTQTSDVAQTSDAAQVSDAAQISDTAQTASTASSDSTDSNAEPATASSDAAESARGSGIDAESSDGASAADGQTADEKSADRQTSDCTDSAGSSSAAQGGESDSAAEGGNAVKSESEESAYPDKKTAAGASDNGGEKSDGNEVRSQFGMESLWSDTSR